MILKNKAFWYLIFVLFLTKSEIIVTAQKKLTIQKISTEDGFLSLLDGDKPAIIFCSMDNCPHCATIGPEFTNIAKNPKYSKILFKQANGPELKIHQHVKRESNNQFKIPGYPVFVFIKNKKINNVLIGGNKEKLEAAIRDFAKKI